VNDVRAVKIMLASPEVIRSWSYGEVKKPETINYRTYRAETDGLFCERIFGPERDWECFCGKYKGMKHKGIVCDRCGVKVTHSRERRQRLGHITLASPIVHIWFFKSMPSRLGTLLALKTTALERVIYYQNYIVVDKGDTPLKDKQLLTEEEFRKCIEKYGEHTFKAMMGAEAIRELLRSVDLDQLSGELKKDLGETKSKQKIKDLTKRLKIVEDLRQSENLPEWMVMDVVPVIPPALRPMVLLESGNFATSDLNDLYRRIINRNNRLKKLIELNAPEVIIYNEKRMLQQAVDALFDNARCKRLVLGSSNRPLKSLTDMIKGKQGRFRENLLGKRVDYSARSVIVVGPELNLNQVGLPKKIALELYQPFIIRRLKELGYADTIKSAKKMLERKDEEVWDILESVIQHHPVMLNRAPTLHRMGIQAFEPVLVEGNAIRIHPLVCKGFNADFDGDQMAVHLPLSVEAQTEARMLMMSTNNIFSPANGQPIITASQDIVLGIYYMTAERPEAHVEEPMRFADTHEVIYAYEQGLLKPHTPIVLRRFPDKEIRGKGGTEEAEGATFHTTVGRVLFNDILDPEMPFYNFALNQKAIAGIIADCHAIKGRPATIELLDNLKQAGFKAATLSGLSFSLFDLKVPTEKNKIIGAIQKEVDSIQKAYNRGVITDSERHHQVVDAWTRAREEVGNAMMDALHHDERDVADEGRRPYLNPIAMMADSGARGSKDQIRQLAGMRGLMAKPSGEIIETPIKSNFRQGLSVLEYFSSTHGARKGLADTALKTADSGYLTRKLADVAQDNVITMDDCGTIRGITKGFIDRGEKTERPLWKALVGRTARDNIVDILHDEVVVAENELIDEDKAKKLQAMGHEKIRVRSPLTCEADQGLCAKCYGADRSMGGQAELGLAVGIVAAQSIGEPGTQLTMRTFHIGGTASRVLEESEIKAHQNGAIKYESLRTIDNEEGQTLVLNRSGDVLIVDAKERELERFTVPAGATMHLGDGDKVSSGDVIARWEPHSIPILSEVAGRVRYEDLKEGETLRLEVEPRTGVTRRQVIEHKGDLHPQIIVEDDQGKILAYYPIPEKAYIDVEDGDRVKAGTMLAKTPRSLGGVQDITGGLPRVTELFEARKPKEPAIISEIDGVVELKAEKRRGRRMIVVKSESGLTKEHLVPLGKHLRVHAGDYVRSGEPLVEGPLVLQDILRISGEDKLQDYLLHEVQAVYRSQDVTIDDKHIEIIVSQMMRRVQVENPGDTSYLPGAVVDRVPLNKINQQLARDKKKPATYRPLLLGITKAALQCEGFLSAASFQETMKVLTEAALAGRVDHLRGLKENVILGRLIPAGTGFSAHRHTEVVRQGGDRLTELLEEAMAAEEGETAEAT
jgi:DNA-directed RNA polymerase subunit beta'